MKLYHLSPLKLTELDPAFSQGADDVVWITRACNLAWALRHLEKRHKEPMRFLHTVDVPRKHLRHRRSGVYTCPHVLTVMSVTDVEDTTYGG